MMDDPSNGALGMISRGSHRVYVTGRDVVTLVREEEITFLAAAIAYFAFVSVLPALLLATAVASAIGGEALVESVLAGTEEFLTASGRETIETTLTSARGRSGASIVGLVLLAWSALRVLKGLDIAFSRVYGTLPATSLAGQIWDAVLVLLTVGASIWGMIVGGSILATLVPAGGDLFGLVTLLVGLTVVFYPLYYLFPDDDISPREALPGTIFAAVGWVGLQAGFQVYAANAAQFSLYDVIGAILLLVTWFYLAAILLLTGAALNYVLQTAADDVGERNRH